MNTTVISHSAEHSSSDKTASLGFWIYIMTDLLLFATLFIGFQVLRTHNASGPVQTELFRDDLGYVLIETFVLLTSSFTFAMAHLAQMQRKSELVLRWLAITFVLGAIFIAMEVYEFHHLISLNEGPQVSAFLSAYFGLVGTHGLHVTSGLLWMAVLFVQIQRFGLNSHMTRRVGMLSIFWHFLDIVWICVYTEVYLLGALA